MYLNDKSINSHLSSLGVGLETTKTAIEGSETSVSGKFSGIVPTPIAVFGSTVSGEEIDNSQTESSVDITDPYRFQELIRQIKKSHEIKLPKKGDEVEYGDVVAVGGIVSPLSFFRFEIAQDANVTLGNSTIAAMQRMNDFKEALEKEGLDDEKKELEEKRDDNNLDPTSVKEARTDLNDTFVQISKGLTGGRVPIRIDGERGFGGETYGAVLDREELRIPPSRAFSQPRKYTIFGRVEDTIPQGETWNPVDTIRVIESFATGDGGAETFLDMIQEVARNTNIEMKDEHITVDGPATIIDPLAVYW